MRRSACAPPQGASPMSFRKFLRRLVLEQFEDRRLLAAVDDHYAVHANTTRTVNGLGTWSNDSYNGSWDVSHWDRGAWIDGAYDEDGNWIDAHWEYDPPVWVQGTDGHAWDSIIAQPQHGALTRIDTGLNWTDYDQDGNETGHGQSGLAFRFTPDTGYVGPDGFAYSLSDDTG